MTYILFSPSDRGIMDLTQTVIVCCDWGKYQLSSLECTFIVPKYYITLPTKVCLVKAMVFPVVMYGCESLDCEES